MTNYMNENLLVAVSGAKAACSVHGSPSGLRNGVRFSRLPRTEAGIYPAVVDIGTPLMDGRVVPLSVKTLILLSLMA